jgi:hypothetical protein
MKAILIVSLLLGYLTICAFACNLDYTDPVSIQELTALNPGEAVGNI